jgi:hypothetical protein
MKKHIVKTTLFTLVAAALMAVPAVSRAQASSTEKPAATTPAPKKHGLPFHGKVTAVDAAAMTLTLKALMLTVTDETKIMKEGKAITLADIKVGEPVSGAYKKDADGKLTATVIHVGLHKKKSAQ